MKRKFRVSIALFVVSYLLSVVGTSWAYGNVFKTDRKGSTATTRETGD